MILKFIYVDNSRKVLKVEYNTELWSHEYKILSHEMMLKRMLTIRMNQIDILQFQRVRYILRYIFNFEDFLEFKTKDNARSCKALLC